MQQLSQWRSCAVGGPRTLCLCTNLVTCLKRLRTPALFLRIPRPNSPINLSSRPARNKFSSAPFKPERISDVSDESRAARRGHPLLHSAAGVPPREPGPFPAVHLHQSLHDAVRAAGMRSQDLLWRQHAGEASPPSSSLTNASAFIATLFRLCDVMRASFCLSVTSYTPSVWFCARLKCVLVLLVGGYAKRWLVC